MLLLHAGFVFTGIATVLLGPLLPFLAARWSLSDSQAGLFFTAQFTGSLCGTALTSLLLPRRGFRFVFRAGYALMACGIALLWHSSWLGALLSVIVCGVGLGLVIPATNLWAGETAGKSRAATIALLNLSWSAGAIACAPLLVASAQRGGPGIFLTGLAVSLSTVALLAAFLAGEAAESASSVAEIPRQGHSPAPGPASFIFLGLLFFLYVGSENALGGWVASHAQRIGGGSLWLLTPSLFWGGLLLGRALLPAALRVARDSEILLASLLLSATGTLLLLTAQSGAMLVAATAASGLGLGTVYPLFIAHMTAAFATKARRVGAVFFSLSSCGGALLPWMVGAISAHRSSLRAGLIVPFAGILLMLGIWMLRPYSTRAISLLRMR
ncbi:MAG: MFS transporter [Acidobacteriia bacterium]|nr:MFS transporter [Terriglobia bacterium]